MKPLVLVYVNNPMCSIECADAVCEVLNKSGSYRARMIGPDSFPFLELTEENLKKAKCLVMPGGNGDADQFDKKLKDKSKIITDFVARGGRYLGICMGAYFAGSRFLNLLRNADAVQYIKRKNCTVTRDKHDVVTISWLKQEKVVYFHDGAAFIPVGRSRIPARIIARYQNNDIAALIQRHKKGKIGVIGPHPEAQKWWFYSQTRIRKKWKDCVQNDLLLEFTSRLLK